MRHPALPAPPSHPRRAFNLLLSSAPPLTILASLPIVATLATLALLAAPAPSSLLFTDVTSASGISFVHTDGGSGRRYIVETVSCGLATLDFDGDGDLDLYFPNGAPLPGSPPSNPTPRHALYRNDGNWRLTDVTETAGIVCTNYGLGVCVADYDNDGDQDIYLNNFGPNILYRNNGDGTFTDVTRHAGVGNGNKVGAGACFFDMDHDGDLDLVVGNYLDFRFEDHQPRLIQGHPAYPGPHHYRPLPDTLYRNNGDGTFTDVSLESGIAALAGTTMGMIAADYDDDGDTDLIVGNDAQANFVWQNDGSGHFKEVGLASGLAYDSHGVGQGTMGVECADADNDGRLDVHMTSYQKQWALLYRNLGKGLFQEVTALSGAGAGSYHEVTWGNGLFDLDNDGDRDLFMACGHLQDLVESWDDTTRYRSPNLLLENIGKGRFLPASQRAGPGLAVRRSSRGVAFDDLDGDGDLDVVILNSRQEPTLLRNDSAPGNHWIRIRLRGRLANRDGVGARLTVHAGDLTLTAEVHSGRGYQSAYQLHPHFGLGTCSKVDRIQIRWPGGRIQTVATPPIDRILHIEEAIPAPGEAPRR